MLFSFGFVSRGTSNASDSILDCSKIIGDKSAVHDMIYPRSLNLTTGEETCYYYLGSRRIAYKKGDDLEYTHNDHLTGTSLTTDSAGDVVANVKYFPFGSTRYSSGNLNTDKLFTGQRLDETGLYFYNARYYDAEIGRFISPDALVPEAFNPQSLNRYSYCLNNPLRYIDPSGHIENDPSQPLSPGQMLQFFAEVTYYNSGGGYVNWTMKDATNYLGIDSDWGDMLSRANWGDTVKAKAPGYRSLNFQLLPGMQGFENQKTGNIGYRGLFELMVQTSEMKYHTGAATLTLVGNDSFKLDDGQKRGDKLKAGLSKLGDAAGTIGNTILGAVEISSGFTIGLVSIGATVFFTVETGGAALPFVGPLGFCGANTGWEIMADGIHRVSQGELNPPTLSSSGVNLPWLVPPIP